MTCLVAWRGKKATWIGADSAWTAGTQQGLTREPKLWKNGRFVIACAGSLRALQMLKHSPQFDHTVPDSALVTHLIRDYVPATQNMLEGNKVPGEAEAQMEAMIYPFEMLIVSRKKLIKIGGDLSVVEDSVHYAAGGSGEEVSLGYCAAQPRNADEYKVVSGALKASARHNAGVKPPFHYEVLS